MFRVQAVVFNKDMLADAVRGLLIVVAVPVPADGT